MSAERFVTFREADLKRAVKTVAAQGLPISGVEITREGTIRILTAASGVDQRDELAEWRAQRGARKAQGA